MIVCIVEWRGRLQIQRGKHLNPFAPCDELIVLSQAAPALGGVAGEQDGDGVKLWAGEASNPVVRMVLSGVAQHLCPANHALLELFGERGERALIDAECTQAVPG